MSDFKEFQAQTLDAAMKDACTYFDVSREKLEVEIIQDAKSGIFGIVGARKAKIRARRASLKEELESVLGKNFSRRPLFEEDDFLSEMPSPLKPFERHAIRGEKSSILRPDSDNLSLFGGDSLGEGKPSEKEVVSSVTEERKSSMLPKSDISGTIEEGKPLPKKREEASRRTASSRSLPPQGAEENPLSLLSKEELCSVSLECVRRLAQPLLGDCVSKFRCDVKDGGVCVSAEDEESCSPIMGKEGNILASIQHLASSIVSKRFGVAVHIRIEIGDYRRRQDDKLRELAQSLVRKVLETGKNCSTRPLNSYQRRLVHLELQGQEGISVRIVGEGDLRRVLVMKKKGSTGSEN